MYTEPSSTIFRITRRLQLKPISHLSRAVTEPPDEAVVAVDDGASLVRIDAEHRKVDLSIMRIPSFDSEGRGETGKFSLRRRQVKISSF